MSSINMSELKANQDTTDSRRQEFSERFASFRDGLLERLEQLTAEALEIGLRGVRPLQRITESAELLEATLSFNDVNLRMIIPNKALRFAEERDSLAYRIFIFFAESREDAVPLLDIVCRQVGRGSYHYQIRALSPEGWDKRGKMGRLTKQGGQRAAEYLVNFVYGMETVWHSAPMLGKLRSGGMGSRPIGFRTGQANE